MTHKFTYTLAVVVSFALGVLVMDIAKDSRQCAPAYQRPYSETRMPYTDGELQCERLAREGKPLIHCGRVM